MGDDYAYLASYEKWNEDATVESIFKRVILSADVDISKAFNQALRFERVMNKWHRAYGSEYILELVELKKIAPVLDDIEIKDFEESSVHFKPRGS